MQLFWLESVLVVFALEDLCVAVHLLKLRDKYLSDTSQLFPKAEVKSFYFTFPSLDLLTVVRTARSLFILNLLRL